MDPGIIGVFIPILGIVGVFGIIGLKTWSNHQLKMRETSGGDNERLTEAVQHLSEEVASMREGLAELYERVDFTERMLAETRSKNVIGPGDST